MGRWNPRIAYVDCFAGPGRYRGGEPGSPIVALEIARKFIENGSLSPDRLMIYAIEANKRHLEHLRTRCNEYLALHPELSPMSLALLQGRYDEKVGDVQADIQRGAIRAIPTFYLIDPFGIKDLPFDLLSRLLSPERNELMFNLMYEETNRFMGRPEFEPHLDVMFGEEAWRSLRSSTGRDRKSLLVDYFKKRLFTAGARYVQVFEMRNRSNASDYFLFFATKNRRGLEVMKEAMWGVDRSGQFAFSDYTYSLGPMLIEPVLDYSVLQRQIKERFDRRRGVRIAEIKEFVLTETSFFRFKGEALRPMMSRNECHLESDSDSGPLDDNATMSFIGRTGTPMSLFERT